MFQDFQTLESDNCIQKHTYPNSTCYVYSNANYGVTYEANTSRWFRQHKMGGGGHHVSLAPDATKGAKGLLPATYRSVLYMYCTCMRLTCEGDV